MNSSNISLAISPMDSSSLWDNYVIHHPQSTPFHHWDWLTLMAAASNSTFIPLTFLQAGTVTGIAPLIVRARGPFKTANWVSFPYLGILTDPFHLEEALEVLADFQNSKRIGLLQIGFPPGTVVAGSILNSSEYSVCTESTMMLSFSGRSKEEIWDAMPSRRWNVRQARKSGVQVRDATAHEVCEELPRILAEVFASRTLPVPYSPRAFELVWERYHDDPDVHMTTAEYQGEVAAIMVTIADSRRAFLWQGASWHRYRQVNANSLLYWDAICWAHDRGCQELDMVGSPDEGIGRFKAGFGSVPVPFLVLRRRTSRLHSLGHRAHGSIHILGCQVKRYISTVRERLEHVERAV